VIDLTSKLTIAKNNLNGYQNRASAVSDAQSTAIERSDQASKVANGMVHDSRKEKRKTKKYYTMQKIQSPSITTWKTRRREGKAVQQL